MKSYPNFTLDYVLHDLSYANLILLSSILPSYDSEEKIDTKKSISKSNTKGLGFGEFLTAMKGIQ